VVGITFLWNIHADRLIWLATHPSVFVIYDRSDSRFSNILYFLMLVSVNNDEAGTNQNCYPTLADQWNSIFWVFEWPMM
jgi:hypothetical protein